MEGIDQAVIYKMLDARIGVFLVSVYRTMSLWMWLSYDKNYFLGMLLTALTQLYIPWLIVFQIDGNVIEGDGPGTHWQNFLYHYLMSDEQDGNNVNEEVEV